MKSFAKLAITACAVTLFSVAAQFCAPTAHAASGDTLKAVKQRGHLNCTGQIDSYRGFAEVDNKGNWKGLDVDLCKAVATAIFGDPKALKLVPISWEQRWPALQSGDVDIVIMASGATLSRTGLGLMFSNSYYLGTTKVMAHKSLGLKSFKDGNGGTVCVPAGTTIENQVTSYAKHLGIKVKIVAIEKTEELEAAYFSGRCDMYAQWGPVLGIARSTQKNPADNVILPDVLAVEPEVMIVRQGDDAWLNLANWVLSALLTAEQDGITSKNVDQFKAKPPTVEISKLLGVTPGMGKPIGLSDDWAYNVIKKVGNYSEIFDHSLGKDTPYKMPRDLTALWSDGGVLYPWVID